MFDKLQKFKGQGYILVSRLKRDDAMKTLKTVLDYFPKFDSKNGEEYSCRREFECFFHKLEKEYPNIFLMDMYGIQTLWNYILCYRDGTLNGNMGIRQSALLMYEIICYLYSCLPDFVSLEEMPSYNVDEKYKSTVEGIVMKEEIQNKTLKKDACGLLLANDIHDGWNAHAIKKYYEDYKKELEREFVLKNYTRCHFEEVLLQKCNEEISKCDEGLLISTCSGIENLSGIFKDKSDNRECKINCVKEQ